MDYHNYYEIKLLNNSPPSLISCSVTLIGYTSCNNGIFKQIE